MKNKETFTREDMANFGQWLFEVQPVYEDSTEEGNMYLYKGKFYLLVELIPIWKTYYVTPK